MARRFDAYKSGRGDNYGDPEFWNKRFEDIDLRLHARELDGQKIAEAIDLLTAVALQRLNDTFTPLILDAQARLANFGVLFTGRSDSEVEIAVGARSFVLTAATRTGFVFVNYISAVPDADPTASIVARVVSYERESGLLVTDAELVDGSGIHAGWTISVASKPDLQHATRTDNPHQTTAAQVGTYTTDQIDAALQALAPLASPSLTGTPTAPTPLTGDSGDRLATTALAQAKVNAAIAALRAGAPGNLDTLDKLAAALGDDADFAATVTGALALKAPLGSPALTGAPTAPTPETDDNTTRIATTAMVQAKVAAALAALLNGAPASYDTLQEIAAWIANDETAEAAILAAVALRLRVDVPQGLTESQQAQVRANASVAPVIASAAHKVMTVNPGLLISQENGDTSGNTTGFHAADQWQLDRTNLALEPVAFQRQAETAEVGLKHRLRLSVPVYVTPANAAGTIRQKIEGTRLRELGWLAGGGVMTVALLARSSVTAIKSLAFRRTVDAGASYIREITFAAGVVVFDTFLLPAPAAHANWGDGTAYALSVDLVARAGSSYVAAAAGQWVAGDRLAGPNHQNADDWASSVDLLALVLLPGNVPVRREDMPYLVRRSGEEDGICRRYFELFGGDGTGQVYASNAAAMMFGVTPGKRIAPEISLFDASAPQIAEVGFGSHTVTAISGAVPNEHGVYINCITPPALTVGRMVMTYGGPGQWLAANSR